jgi:hypothetical protein
MDWTQRKILRFVLFAAFYSIFLLLFCFVSWQQNWDDCEKKCKKLNRNEGYITPRDE